MSKFSFGKKFNTAKIFNIETEGFDYISLEDLAAAIPADADPNEVIFIVRGIYLNKKGLYEPAPVVALDDCYVNLPSHLYDTCADIIADNLAVAAINDGKVGFRIEKYFQKKYQKDCYSVEWVDL